MLSRGPGPTEVFTLQIFSKFVRPETKDVYFYIIVFSRCGILHRSFHMFLFDQSCPVTNSWGEGCFFITTQCVPCKTCLRLNAIFSPAMLGLAACIAFCRMLAPLLPPLGKKRMSGYVVVELSHSVLYPEVQSLSYGNRSSDDDLRTSIVKEYTI